MTEATALARAGRKRKARAPAYERREPSLELVRPTPELAAKSGTAIGDDGSIKIIDALDWMVARRLIEPVGRLFRAGTRFYADWANSGREQLVTAAYDGMPRNLGGGTRIAPLSPRQGEYRDRHHAACQALGPLLAGALTEFVLDVSPDARPEDRLDAIALRIFGRVSRRAKDTTTDLLRAGLEELAKHYGC